MKRSQQSLLTGWTQLCQEQEKVSYDSADSVALAELSDIKSTVNAISRLLQPSTDPMNGTKSMHDDGCKFPSPVQDVTALQKPSHTGVTPSGQEVHAAVEAAVAPVLQQLAYFHSHMSQEISAIKVLMHHLPGISGISDTSTSANCGQNALHVSVLHSASTKAPDTRDENLDIKPGNLSPSTLPNKDASSNGLDKSTPGLQVWHFKLMFFLFYAAKLIIDHAGSFAFHYPTRILLHCQFRAKAS